MLSLLANRYLLLRGCDSVGGTHPRAASPLAQALKTPEQLEILGSNTVSPLLESPKPKTVMTLPSVVKSHVSGWWSEIQVRRRIFFPRVQPRVIPVPFPSIRLTLDDVPHSHPGHGPSRENFHSDCGAFHSGKKVGSPGALVSPVCKAVLAPAPA